MLIIVVVFFFVVEVKTQVKIHFVHCSSEMKDYETFKIYGDKFYRDVVVQLCFSEEETPSREVIERLMSHIINAPNSGNEDKLMSKNISILEEGFDQVPVVRSFLLQQILRTK